jgi:antitoxin component YwqK of YwqJK toxin-antitoxin module
MKIKIISFYFIAFLISFSANAQSTIDTIHYSNSFKICSKENSYFIKLIRFDSDSKIVGDITSLLGRHGLPQNKNELKKAFEEGRFEIKIVDGHTIRTSVYTGIDKKYEEESYGKITEIEIVDNEVIVKKTSFTYSDNDGSLIKTITTDKNSNRIEYTEYYGDTNKPTFTYRYVDEKKVEQRFDKSGNLESETKYNTKQKIEELRLYYDNGKLKEINIYNNQEDPIKIDYTNFFENGKTRYKGTFVIVNGQNIEVELWTLYDEKGNIVWQEDQGNIW